MPRPGPRPYECVRRAWHSDRHQPIRGSLIQEIFRVVNEIHSSATRKNKEWQDKLPLVVLKAEEIMYSKANSEAEYMDLKTLPERASDAINTIIRRDEASESGDLLPPCIEAALNLGCIPRRASRSQRHNSPRCYLSSTTQEATESSVPKIADNKVFNGGAHFLPPQSINPTPNSGTQFMPHQSALLTATTANATYLTAGSGRPVLQDKPMFHSDSSLLAENFSPCWQDRSSVTVETQPIPSLGHMHPMCYKSNGMESSFSFQYPQVSDHDAVVGVPHASPVLEAEKGFQQNLLGYGNPLDASPGESVASLNFGITSEKTVDMGCDLSLRLGPFSTPCLIRENGWTVEDVASSGCPNRSRFCDTAHRKMSTGQFGCWF